MYRVSIALCFICASVALAAREGQLPVVEQPSLTGGMGPKIKIEELKKPDPVEPKRQECETMESKLDQACDKLDKNDIKDPRCKNGKLVDPKRLTVVNDKGTLTCKTEEEVLKDTGKEVCTDIRGTKKQGDASVCTSGVTKIVALPGVNAESAARAGIKCYKEEDVDLGDGKFIRQVIICNDEEDQKKLQNITRVAALGNQYNKADAPTAPAETPRADNRVLGKVEEKKFVPVAKNTPLVDQPATSLTPDAAPRRVDQGPVGAVPTSPGDGGPQRQPQAGTPQVGTQRITSPGVLTGTQPLVAAAPASPARVGVAPERVASEAPSSNVGRAVLPRTYTAPTYSSPATSTVGSGTPASFFSQFLTPSPAYQSRGDVSRQVTPVVYPVQQFGLQPAALVSQVKVPPAPGQLELPRQTVPQRQTLDARIEELRRLLTDETLSPSTPKDTAVPAQVLSTKDQEYLRMLSEGPSIEELARRENKKIAEMSRPVNETQSRPSFADTSSPVVQPAIQKEVDYVPPARIAQSAKKEQNILEQLGIQGRPLDTHKPLSTIRVSSADVRAVISKTLAPVVTAYAESSLPSATRRDAFAAQLTTLTPTIESAAYGLDYEGSIRILALAKQVENVSYRIARGDSVSQVRSELITIQKALSSLAVSAHAPTTTLATLPQLVSEWRVEHFNFYLQHLIRLKDTATTEKAKALYGDAVRLTSFASTAQSTSPTQWDLQSYIDSARSKVSLAQSIERDAVRARLVQPASSPAEPSFFKTLLNAFGF